MRPPQVCSLPTVGKVATMVATTLPIILLGSVLYRLLTKTEWFQSLTKSYYAVTGAPGVLRDKGRRERKGGRSAKTEGA
jgi:hypothetical protein